MGGQVNLSIPITQIMDFIFLDTLLGMEKASCIQGHLKNSMGESLSKSSKLE